jgi:hypothetical protein
MPNYPQLLVDLVYIPLLHSMRFIYFPSICVDRVWSAIVQLAVMVVDWF